METEERLVHVFRCRRGGKASKFDPREQCCSYLFKSWSICITKGEVVRSTFG